MEPCRVTPCGAGILTGYVKTRYKKELHDAQQTGGTLSMQVIQILMQSGLSKENLLALLLKCAQSEWGSSVPELRRQN